MLALFREIEDQRALELFAAERERRTGLLRVLVLPNPNLDRALGRIDLIDFSDRIKARMERRTTTRSASDILAHVVYGNHAAIKCLDKAFAETNERAGIARMHLIKAEHCFAEGIDNDKANRAACCFVLDGITELLHLAGHRDSRPAHHKEIVEVRDLMLRLPGGAATIRDTVHAFKRGIEHKARRCDLFTESIPASRDRKRDVEYQETLIGLCLPGNERCADRGQDVGHKPSRLRLRAQEGHRARLELAFLRRLLLHRFAKCFCLPEGFDRVGRAPCTRLILCVIAGICHDSFKVLDRPGRKAVFVPMVQQEPQCHFVAEAQIKNLRSHRVSCVISAVSADSDPSPMDQSVEMIHSSANGGSGIRC